MNSEEKAMKLLHLSDLHIGKRVNEFPMIDDQKFILERILGIVDEIKPDGVMISGDLYDKSFAPAESVAVVDSFLVELNNRNQKVFVISGNHDSPERVAYGGRLMESRGVYLSPVFDGHIDAITLEDEHGPIHFYLLPFIKPSHVRMHFPDAKIEDYNDALQTVFEDMKVNQEERNVLLCHQFVTGATRSDSEDVTVGGLDQVSASVFDDFDYVALGHIHSPQRVTRDTIRYCGTPLKYSFSEAADTKSVTVVEFGPKGEIAIDTIELKPLHDLREIRGSYNEITSKEFREGQVTDDYLHITLTDDEDIPNVLGILRGIYPNLMKLDYDNRRTRAVGYTGEVVEEEKSGIELFAELYAMQNGTEMTREQFDFVNELIGEIWEDL